MTAQPAQNERYSRMIRGDFRQFEEACDAETGDWPWVFQTLYASARGATPELQQPASNVGWLGVRQVALQAAVAFDLDTLERVVSLSGDGPLAHCVRALARGWKNVWGGQHLQAIEYVEALTAWDPGAAIEVASLEAVAALHIGDRDRALATARRASRMAGAEGILQMEYLANLVLARVRRHCGNAHLALRILSALHKVVPAGWHRWVNSERYFAGDSESEALPSCPAVDAELATLRALMGGPMVPAADAWCRAEDDDPPYGLFGEAVDPIFVAAMVLRPNEAGRRLLFSRLDDGLQLIASAPKARRLRLALCRMAEQPKGIDAAELFEGVYGFAREDSGHDELLRGLLHRARKALSGYGDIERDKDRILLRCAGAFAVPDPRCERSLGERVLSYLSALDGRATAKQIAQGLGVPLRSVQRTLGDLIEDGACESQPDGRRTEYVLEDTTFAEPTLHRLRGSL